MTAEQTLQAVALLGARDWGRWLRGQGLTPEAPDRP